MYKIAICDDDEFYLKELFENVTKYLKEKNLYYKVIPFSDGWALLSDIENNKLYDIYILDIEMPCYSGIDISKAIANYDCNPIIIFVTSHIKYAVDSYNYNIFRFIPKKELEQRFPLALNAAFSRLDEQKEDFYYIQNDRRCLKIPYRDIVYIYKSEKNSIIVLSNSEIKVRKTLKELFNELKQEDFIFVDRCYIVNIQMINGIDDCMAKLSLKTGKYLDISKSRIQEVKKALNAYWGKRI